MSTKRLAANFTRNATSFASVDNGSGDALSFAVTNGKRYRFRIIYLWSSAATTTGLDIACSGPSASYVSGLRWIQTSTTAYGTRCAFNGYDQSAPGTAIDTIDAVSIAVLEGVMKASADGTFIARVASEVASSTITVLAGSVIEWECLDDLVTEGKCVFLSEDVTNSTLVLADVAGVALGNQALKFPVSANKRYGFRFNVLWWSVTSTTSISLAINGPASPTAVWARNIIGNQLTGTAITEGNLRAYEVATTGANRPNTGSVSYAVIEGVLRNGANAGDVIARFASEIDTSQVTVMLDSSVEFFEIAAPPVLDCPNEVGYYFPEDAADFAATDQVLPGHWYLCQGADIAAAGDDQQTVGSDIDLTKNGTVEFDQTFGAASRKGIHFTQNADERVIFGDPYNVNTQSLMIDMALVVGDQSTTRAVAVLGTGPELWIRIASTEVLGITLNGVTNNGNFSYLSTGVFHAQLCLDHRSPGAVVLTTKHQRLVGTYAAPGNFTGKCIGSDTSVVANLCFVGDLGYLAVWGGTDAEVRRDEGPANRFVVAGV